MLCSEALSKIDLTSGIVLINDGFRVTPIERLLENEFGTVGPEDFPLLFATPLFPGVLDDWRAKIVNDIAIKHGVEHIPKDGIVFICDYINYLRVYKSKTTEEICNFVRELEEQNLERKQ